MTRPRRVKRVRHSPGRGPQAFEPEPLRLPGGRSQLAERKAEPGVQPHADHHESSMQDAPARQASWRPMARCSFASASVTIGQVPYSSGSRVVAMQSGARKILTVTSGMVTRDVRMMPGGQRVLGHALEFGRDPLAYLQRAREHGDVVRIQ